MSGQLRPDLGGLYTRHGAYGYRNGVNARAVVALVAGVAVALSGLLHPRLGFLFNGSWFSAAIVSFVLYYSLMKSEARHAAL